MKRLKLAEWSRLNNVHHRTANRWLQEGTFPAPYERTPGGHVRVLVEDDESPVEATRIVLYARVSSSGQRDDLARQADRLRAFALGRGLADVEVVTETGSALNGNRPKLLGLLSDPTVGTLVVEHRDRLARFGVPYIEALLAAQGRDLVVMEATDRDLDLVQDFVDVVTSMCARIYGKRGATNRARRALEAAENTP